MSTAKKSFTAIVTVIFVLATAILAVCIAPSASAATTITGKTAKQITAEMGTGWNLGNTLDATGGWGVNSETSWGNPKTTKAMIDAVKKQGFRTVRIPV